MEQKPGTFESIDAYIAAYPETIQAMLQQLRVAIQAAAPDAVEKISYNMPTFYQNGNVVSFSAAKRHIGLYPAPRGYEAFQEELSQYAGSTGTVQFPYDKPLPLDLITRIVQFRVAELQKKQAAKATRKKAP